jgi:hypothetical protein
LVVEADVGDAAPEAGSFYLVQPAAGGPLALSEGLAVADARVVGVVLFLARPPVLDALASPEVLSL